MIVMLALAFLIGIGVGAWETQQILNGAPHIFLVPESPIPWMVPIPPVPPRHRA